MFSVHVHVIRHVYICVHLLISLLLLSLLPPLSSFILPILHSLFLPLFLLLSIPPFLPPSLPSSPYISLQRTTEIFLFENMLETIPPSIFNIPTLQMLNIDRNHIMQIPPTVSHVTIVHVTVATRTLYMYRLVVASRCMFSLRERMI